MQILDLNLFAINEDQQIDVGAKEMDDLVYIDKEILDKKNMKQIGCKKTNGNCSDLDWKTRSKK